MERLDHQKIWRDVRGSLADAPVPVRLALAAETSIERQRAFDRLAAFISLRVIAGTADDDEEEGTLPLFPELVDNGEDPRLDEPAIEGVIEQAPSFGRWLLDQRHREDGIGALAKQAWADPGFPRDGSPKEVSQRLNTLGADGEAHDALDQAELDWLAY